VFTGLVETTAQVLSIERRGPDAQMRFGVELDKVDLGESIACGGVCLTVTRMDERGFDADVSSETLSVTTLGDLRHGSSVNIERSSRLGDRMGGHVVLGHVDGVGRVQSFERVGEARLFVVEAPAALQRYLAPKGSVAVDGVSLTINRLAPGGAIEIMLVPHTLDVTTLGRLKTGDRVNLEVDVLARYVARQLEHAGVIGTTTKDARILGALDKGGFLQ
jgi:riboflavin synthase